MGASVGNTRLAGEAAARQRAAASEGIRMRRAAVQKVSQGGGGGNPGVMGENTGMSPNAVARQEMSAARPDQVTSFERSAPQFAPGLEANPPRGPLGSRLGRVEQELAEKGSPAYEQMMQRIRGMNSMQNTGSNF
jgi:hypothetical protein